MMMERALIYADNNATTAVAPEVVEAMGPYWGSFLIRVRCMSRRCGWRGG